MRSSGLASWPCCRTSEGSSLGAPFRVTRRVEFRDTDAAGIVHFSVFFTYMEQAEHELWRQIGLQIVATVDQEVISWPRVSAACDYTRPIGFPDEVAIDVSIRRIGQKSLTYRFDFWRNQESIAVGQLVTACCRIRPHQPPLSMEIPEAVAQRLAPFVIES